MVRCADTLAGRHIPARSAPHRRLRRRLRRWVGVCGGQRLPRGGGRQRRREGWSATGSGGPSNAPERSRSGYGPPPARRAWASRRHGPWRRHRRPTPAATGTTPLGRVRRRCAAACGRPARLESARGFTEDDAVCAGTAPAFYGTLAPCEPFGLFAADTAASRFRRGCEATGFRFRARARAVLSAPGGCGCKRVQAVAAIAHPAARTGC